MADDRTFWYRDAIIYELHIKAFFDADNDGIGDFEGLIRKLDYLKELGVTAVWLLPFYPSPQKDDGYDIADYYAVHPDYGTMRDFRTLIEEAHERGIRVITELVLNHTSDRHLWFQRARAAPEGSPERNYYVWSKTVKKYEEVRIIFEDFENSNWTWDDDVGAYYWHRFYSHQPDLNFDNSAVKAEIFRVIDFWLETGVDGFRLDAVPYLFERDGTNCENLPETHAFLKELRAHVDKKAPDKQIMLLAEANQWPEDAIEYFGDDDECNMAFNFPIMPRLFMAIRMEDKFPITDIIDQTPMPPGNSQWGLFLRNHDELTLEMVTDEERDYMYRMYAQDPRTVVNLGIRRRLAPLLNNDRRKIELMNILLFSLPGTPFIYYGDEIGMGDNHFLGDRHGVRTPMQWNTDRNAGFSKANPQQLYLPLIIDPTYHHSYVNVENQEKNASSLLWWMRQIITIRKNHPAFARGELRMVPSANPKVLAFLRLHREEVLLVVVNLSQFSQDAALELQEYDGYTPLDLFSKNRFHEIAAAPYKIMIPPHEYYWLQLKQPKEGVIEMGEPVEITLAKGWHALFDEEHAEAFAYHALRSHLSQSHWFDIRSREIRRVSIVDVIFLDRRADAPAIVIYEVRYFDRTEERYMIPLDFAYPKELPPEVLESAGAVVCTLKIDGKEGYLYDAVHANRFRTLLIEVFAKRRELKGQNGRIAVAFDPEFKRRCRKEPLPEISTILQEKKKNSHIDYEKRFFLKLHRRLEEDLPPDREMMQYLRSGGRFLNVPGFLGTVDYCPDGGACSQLALIEEWIADAYSACDLFYDSAMRFFDELLADPPRDEQIKRPGFYRLDTAIDDIPEVLLRHSERFIFEMAEQLGKRIAQMHAVLARPCEEEAFSPQPFSTLYLRAHYQSFRTVFRKMCMNLAREEYLFGGEKPVDAPSLIEQEEHVLHHFKHIYERRLDGMKIRIHDDLNLENILFNGKDFVMIDFGGDKTKPNSERRLKRPVFSDLADVMFSMDLATFRAIRDNPKITEEESCLIARWRDIYRGYLFGVLLSGYLSEADRTEGLYPKEPEALRLLLDMELLKKASIEANDSLHERDRFVHALQFALSSIASYSDTGEKPCNRS